MALRREGLQTLLENTLGNTNVYYSPPDGTKMKYPAIRYKRERIRNEYANNLPYNKRRTYRLTVMYYDPDFDKVEEIASLPKCSHVSDYTKDNLNHSIFNIEY